VAIKRDGGGRDDSLEKLRSRVMRRQGLSSKRVWEEKRGE